MVQQHIIKLFLKTEAQTEHISKCEKQRQAPFVGITYLGSLGISKSMETIISVMKIYKEPR